MSSNFPGAFPGSFPTNPTNTNNNSFQNRAPTSSTFNFSPSKQEQSSSSLYPNLCHLNNNNNNNSHNNKGAAFLSNECEKLGYSNKLSTNVLSELDQRASSKLTSSSPAKPMQSPRQRGLQNSNRFNRLESISSHYAVIRHQQNNHHSQHQPNTINEDMMEIEKENIPAYDPNSKRSMDSHLSSISKRRRTELGSKKVIPEQPKLPTSKRVNNLGSILHGSSRQSRPSIRHQAAPQSARPAPSLPPPPMSGNTQTRSGVPTSSSFRFQPAASSAAANPIKSTRRRENTSSSRISTSKTMNNLSNITNTINDNELNSKKMRRSPTIENLTKPTLSSISKSASFRNLKADVVGGSSIPRSKTTRFGESTANSRPIWR